VLWDVDYTLLDAGGAGMELYRIAFGELFGGEPPVPGRMSGRTDRAIALEVLTLAGIPDPRRHITAFQAVMAAHAEELTDVIRSGGTALPGAAEALAALASARSGHASAADGDTSGTDGNASGAAGDAAGADGAGDVVQALLTGNIRALAEVKLAALGLCGHLDFDVGAYGDVHEVRSELVGPARRKAALAYGADFGGEATVLVGDTPLDIEAALVTGARAVGVATGHFSVAELNAAGAHAVLPDLTDTGRVLAAVLGLSPASQQPHPQSGPR
jgi:phosphoglycolate phosphatase-like HAD superfamily hydrolase